MTCLGIDTSGESLSVGLSSKGRVLGERFYKGDQPYSVMLIREIEAMLKETGMGLDKITLVATAAGPGRYTALRVGFATAKGIAMARGIPLVRVSSLEVLSRSMLPYDGTICPVVDARRRLVYFARFKATGGSLQRIEGDQALTYETAALRIPEKALLTGNGVPFVLPYLRERPQQISVREGVIHGGEVARLGEKILSEHSQNDLYEGPFYVREVEIQNQDMERRKR